VLLNSESAVIDVGRSQRVVPGSTRRALNVRDRGCRWPGCTRSASWAAAHHIVHWIHGGRTDLSNLVYR
jgi:HNH endonuclease